MENMSTDHLAVSNVFFFMLNVDVNSWRIMKKNEEAKPANNSMIDI